ncbi:MAG TPA: iron ABC transporter permease [Gemmatimonadales bacterium]|nr:iron ABC transporter permease [Gemmatimonadales bacterium]
MSRPRIPWLALGLIALLGWLVVYPLVLVTLGAFRGNEGWTLEFVRAVLKRPTELSAIWNSLWLSVASALLAGLIGLPLAALFALVEFPGRRVLGALIALPVGMPPLVGVVAFLFLFGESGFIARMVQAALRLDQPPWRLEGAWAVLLVHAYAFYGYFYLLGRAGLAGLDRSLLEAAAALGADRKRMLFKVVVPLLRPTLVGAGLLVFLSSLASFSAPYIFGGGFRVMPTQIVATRLNGDDGVAMVETTILTLIALAGLWIAGRLEGRAVLTGGSKGGAPSRTTPATRNRRWAVGVVAWGAGVLLLLPHATLLLLSFVPAGTWTVETLPPVYTSDNYRALLTEPERLHPLLNSCWMAIVATGAALLISIVSGVASVRRKLPGGRVIEALLAVPWAVPGTVFAIALAAVFSVDRPLALRFILIGTPWLLPLAYLIRNLPLASRPVLAGFRGLDPALDEAAASLGAGRWRRLGRITLPLLAPALAAGATLAFATALGDFVTSIVLYTYDTRPISLEILSSLRSSDIGVAAALGMVLTVLAGVVFALGNERRTVSQ